MPVGDTPTASAEWASRPGSWALPIMRLGTIQLRISYAVFLAVTAILIIAFVASSSQGNSDLVRVVFLGALFWVSGWLLQSVTYLGTSRLLGSPTVELCIGLVGVELGPRNWPARRAVLVALGSVTSLIVLGTIYRLVEGGFQLPQMVRSEQPFWATPSIGLTEQDSIWNAAAWLCWGQAIFQLYPLPRTFGRQLIGAMVSLCSRSLDLPLQTRVFRQCLVAISVMMVCIALASVVAGRSLLGVHGIVFFALGVMLWISSRGVDIGLILVGYRVSDEELEERNSLDTENRGLRQLWMSARTWARQRQQQRRLQSVQHRERGEAVDAQRLDEILTRLHREGMEALSKEDQEILDRVSQNLRRQRNDGTLCDPPPD